ncbi:ATP-binding protein [Streptomyces inhibens]|uniref:ATP-binding protein n=1 Tax=Streptomyces inhibens TaxID=2293571 RepID=UPI0037AA5FB9
MLPTTMHGAEVILTARHIDSWPAAASTLIPTDCWRSAQRVVLHLPPLKRAVPVCRSLARTWLDGHRIHDADTRYLVLLVLSELFTNAIRYSASNRITCRLWRSENLLYVEVHDRGGTPSVPRMRRPGQGQEHGRGLELVAKSSSKWGRRVEVDNSCTVWAAVPLTVEAGNECGAVTNAHDGNSRRQSGNYPNRMELPSQGRERTPQGRERTPQGRETGSLAHDEGPESARQVATSDR